MKCTGMSRRAVARFVNRCAAVSYETAKCVAQLLHRDAAQVLRLGEVPHGGLLGQQDRGGEVVRLDALAQEVGVVARLLVAEQVARERLQDRRARVARRRLLRRQVDAAVALVGHRAGRVRQVAHVVQRVAEVATPCRRRAGATPGRRCGRPPRAARRPSPRARGRSCRGRASRRAARRSRAAPPRASPRVRGAAGRSRCAGARIVCSVWSFMPFATRNGGSPSAANTGPRWARSTAISSAARSDGASGSQQLVDRRAEREGDRAQHREPRLALAVLDRARPATAPGRSRRRARRGSCRGRCDDRGCGGRA